MSEDLSAQPPLADAAPAMAALPQPPPGKPIELLYNVEMSVTVELGRTRLPMRDLLGLRPGKVLELDRNVQSPVDVYVNNTLLARGEVVIVDDELGVRVTEIVGSPVDRAAS